MYINKDLHYIADLSGYSEGTIKKRHRKVLKKTKPNIVNLGPRHTQVLGAFFVGFFSRLKKDLL